MITLINHLSFLICIRNKKKKSQTDIPAVKFVLKQYFGDVYRPDNGGTTDNPHNFAKQHLDSVNPTTLDIVNILISYYKQPLQYENRFTYLKYAEWKFYDLPLSLESCRQLIGDVGSGNFSSIVRLPGIYQFTDKQTGKVFYIGSSINLVARINGYLKISSNTIKGATGFLMRNTYLAGLKLGVLVLPDSLKCLHISAEQYFVGDFIFFLEDRRMNFSVFFFSRFFFIF